MKMNIKTGQHSGEVVSALATQWEGLGFDCKFRSILMYLAYEPHMVNRFKLNHDINSEDLTIFFKIRHMYFKLNIVNQKI